MKSPLASRSVRSWLAGSAALLLAVASTRADTFSFSGEGVNAGVIGKTAQKGPPGQDHTGNNVCKDCGNTDPIDLTTGEINFERTDLVLPGLVDPLVLSFQYRSQRTYNGHWGFGWFLPYEMRLFQLTGGNVMWRIGTGEQKTFVRSGSTYTAPADHHVTLTQLGGGGWELKEKGGVVYVFSAEGLLLEIQDRAGNSILFGYQLDGAGAKQKLPVAGPTGAVLALDYQLVLITGTLGKSVTLAYYGSGDGAKNGRLKSLLDDYGRLVSYDYDSAGNLTSVTSPSTTYADVGGGAVTRGRTTTYSYTSGFQSSRPGSPVDVRDHNLLTVVDDRGLTQLTNVYDENDRITSQGFNGATTTIAYLVDSNGRVYQSDETDTNGFLHKHVYDANGNVTQETFYGTGIHTGVSGHVGTNYVYNSAQEVVEIGLPLGNGVEFTYSSQGNVTEKRRKTSITAANNANDLVSTYTYESLFNRVKTSTDELGFTTTFYYDYEEATLGDLNGDSVTSQAAGNVVRVDHPNATLPDGTTQSSIRTQYRYNGYGQLTHTIDPEGHVVERQYYGTGHASFGRLAKVIVDPAGLALTSEYTYDSYGFLATVKDPRGNTTTFTADALGELVDVEAPLDVEFKGTYDANGNLVKSEIRNLDAAGSPQTPGWIVSTQVYDAWNRMTSKTEDVTASVTRTTAIEYDGLSNATKVTSPEGRLVKIDYDERSIPWRTTRGFGTAEASVEVVHVDKNGRTTQTLDGLGQATTYVYDLFDRMTSATDAAGNKVESDWTKRGQAIERRLYNPGNAIATKVQFTYDSLGRTTKRTEVDVTNSSSISESWYEFNKSSLLVKTRSPRGYFTQVAYDAANRRTSATDALGNSIGWSYDANGNPLTVTSTEKVPSASDEVYVTEAVYDALDRVTQSKRIDRLNSSHVLTTSFAYDSRSNLVSTTDPIGRVTTRLFDLASRMTSVTEDSSGLAITTQAAFDKDGLQTSITDASSNTTSWIVDALGRRAKATYADSSYETWGFDHASNLTGHRSQDGVLTSFAYFANNRLQSRSSGALLEEFVWNALGSPTSAKVTKGGLQQSLVTFTYDGFGRLVNEVQDGLTVQHGYDADHNVTALTYPDSFAVTQSFDALDRLSSVSDAGGAVASYAYAGAGRVKTRTSGLTQTNTWDGLKRLIGIQAGSALDLAYGHDDLDRRTYVERNHFAGDGDVYAYDGGSRLQDVWYDATNPSAGNTGALSHLTVNQTKVQDRTSTVLDAVTTTYNTPDSLHRYTQVGSATRVHDAKGNLTDDGSQLFEFDVWNRLTKVKDKSTGAERARYELDALGRRTKKIETGLTTKYVYSGARLLAEYEDTGTGAVMKRRYLYGAGLDEAVAIDSNGSRYLVYQDALGSTELITDNSNAVLERYEYDAFGVPTVRNAAGTAITGAYGRPTSSIKNALWFTGARWDGESAQYYMRARQYDPVTGRFLSADPLGLIDGPNAYAYAFSDPANWCDPFGLSSEPGWFANAYTATLNGLCDSAPFELMARIHDAGEASLAAASDSYRPNYLSNESRDVSRRLRSGESANSLAWEYFGDGVKQSGVMIAETIVANAAFRVAGAGLSAGGRWAMARAPTGVKAAMSWAESSLAGIARQAAQIRRAGGSNVGAALERLGQTAKASLRGVADNLGKRFPKCRRVLDLFGSTSPRTAGQSLYHYTSDAGRAGILDSGELLASQGAKNARYGAGQYFTDIVPEAIGGRTIATTPVGSMSLGQLSSRLFGMPFNARKLSSFLEVDVSGLGARQVAPNIWLIDGQTGLDIAGRIIRSGVTLP